MLTLTFQYLLSEARLQITPYLAGVKCKGTGEARKCNGLKQVAVFCYGNINEYAVDRLLQSFPSLLKTKAHILPKLSKFPKGCATRIRIMQPAPFRSQIPKSPVDV